MARAAEDPNSADPVLALIRAAGLPGFKSSEKPREETSAEERDPVLVLIRKAGLPGFRSANIGRHEAAADADPEIELIRQAGLQGFKPALNAPERSLAQQPSSTTLDAQGRESAIRKKPTSSKPSISARPFAVFHIPAGCEADLAVVEQRLRHPLASDSNGQPYWSEAADQSGGTMRAFDLSQSQQSRISKIAGPLAGTSIRVSIERVPLAAFKMTGPGATGRHAVGAPPQMPFAITDAIDLI